jgi:phosphoribosylanthranilate isomerase
MTRVKICGCRSVADALAAADAGADFIGLMFAESGRRVSVEDAAEIVRALGTPLRELEQTEPPAMYRLSGSPALDGGEDGGGLRGWYEHGASALDRLLERKRPLTVGVFAGMQLDQVNEVADDAGIDLLQLSGGEPWGDCLLANRQVLKVVHVRAADSFDEVIGGIRTGSALAVMLDSTKDGALGGTGKTFDWAIAAGVANAMPVWLAGGLTPENVGEAIARVRPWCVDVSTGVETEGAKDYEKIRRFIAAARIQ